MIDPVSDQDSPDIPKTEDAFRESKIPEPPPPERIGRYHVKRVIASGGMGTVYEATQDNPRRVVAVKVMKQGIASKSALRRFEYEAQILARLRHPGIAQIYEAGTHHDPESAGALVQYFAMEYIPNAKSITQFAADKNLGTRARMELFAKVCEAIHHGHQKGIIHRDLKPSNILVDPGGQVKIIDFGVARSTDSDMAITTLQTDVGQLIGTLQYMSPEQCEADPHDIDIRSDVYALGVVFYELLSGFPPYDVRRMAVYEATRVIREQHPTKLSTMNKKLRGDVETIALKALEKERERRYQSALDFDQDIQRYLDGEAIHARRASFAYQLRLFARRNKGVFASLAAVFVILVAGIIVSTSLYFRAEHARAEQAHERQRAEQARNSAEEQRNRAREAEASAQRRFKQVQELAHTFIFDFHDKIVNLIGATPAREFLVDTVLKYLDNLAQDAGDDRELLRDLATAYRKIGDVQGYPDNPNLGHTNEALVSYRKGLDILEALPIGAANAEEQRDLMLAYRRMGECQGWNDQPLDGIVNLRKALAIAELRATADPRSPQAQRDLGEVHWSLGNCHDQAQQFAEAVANNRTAVLILESLRENDPNDIQTLYALMRAHHRLADLQLRYLGRTAEALGTARRMEVLADTILEAEPANQRVQYERENARYYITTALNRMGHNREALDQFNQQLELQKRRAEADPLDVEAQFDLAIMYGSVGGILWTMGRYAEALEAQRIKLGIIEAVLAAQPDNALAPSAMASAYVSIGETFAGMGENDEALVSAMKAKTLVEPLLEKNPYSVDRRHAMWSAHRLMGDNLSAMGKEAEAWASHSEGLELAKAIAAARPDRPEQQRQLAMSLHSIGDLQLRSGQNTGALESYRQAMAIHEARAAFDPDVAEARRDVAVSYEKMGDVHAAFGRDQDMSVDQRLENFREARSWHQSSANILIDMREHDVLSGRDAHRPAEIAAKIAGCDSGIAELETRNTQP